MPAVNLVAWVSRFDSGADFGPGENWPTAGLQVPIEVVKDPFVFASVFMLLIWAMYPTFSSNFHYSKAGVVPFVQQLP